MENVQTPTFCPNSASIYKTCGTFGDRQVEYKQRTFKMTQTKNGIRKGVAEYQNQLGFITNLL